jgi:hypothetical protein
MLYIVCPHNDSYVLCIKSICITCTYLTTDPLMKQFLTDICIAMTSVNRGCCVNGQHTVVYANSACSTLTM